MADVQVIEDLIDFSETPQAPGAAALEEEKPEDKDADVSEDKEVVNETEEKLELSILEQEFLTRYQCVEMLEQAAQDLPGPHVIGHTSDWEIFVYAPQGNAEQPEVSPVLTAHNLSAEERDFFGTDEVISGGYVKGEIYVPDNPLACADGKGGQELVCSARQVSWKSGEIFQEKSQPKESKDELSGLELKGIVVANSDGDVVHSLRDVTDSMIPVKRTCSSSPEVTRKVGESFDETNKEKQSKEELPAQKDCTGCHAPVKEVAQEKHIEVSNLPAKLEEKPEDKDADVSEDKEVVNETEEELESSILEQELLTRFQCVEMLEQVAQDLPGPHVIGHTSDCEIFVYAPQGNVESPEVSPVLTACGEIFQEKNQPKESKDELSGLEVKGIVVANSDGDVVRSLRDVTDSMIPVKRTCSSSPEGSRKVGESFDETNKEKQSKEELPVQKDCTGCHAPVKEVAQEKHIEISNLPAKLEEKPEDKDADVSEDKEVVNETEEELESSILEQELLTRFQCVEMLEQAAQDLAGAHVIGHTSWEICVYTPQGNVETPEVSPVLTAHNLSAEERDFLGTDEVIGGDYVQGDVPDNPLACADGKGRQELVCSVRQVSLKSGESRRKKKNQPEQCKDELSWLGVKNIFVAKSDGNVFHSFCHIKDSMVPQQLAHSSPEVTRKVGESFDETNKEKQSKEELPVQKDCTGYHTPVKEVAQEKHIEISNLPAKLELPRCQKLTTYRSGYTKKARVNPNVRKLPVEAVIEESTKITSTPSHPTSELPRFEKIPSYRSGYAKKPRVNTKLKDKSNVPVIIPKIATAAASAKKDLARKSDTKQENPSPNLTSIPQQQHKQKPLETPTVEKAVTEYSKGREFHASQRGAYNRNFNRGHHQGQVWKNQAKENPPWISQPKQQPFSESRHPNFSTSHAQKENQASISLSDENDEDQTKKRLYRTPQQRMPRALPASSTQQATPRQYFKEEETAADIANHVPSSEALSKFSNKQKRKWNDDGGSGAGSSSDKHWRNVGQGPNQGQRFFPRAEGMRGGGGNRIWQQSQNRHGRGGGMLMPNAIPGVRRMKIEDLTREKKVE